MKKIVIGLISIIFATQVQAIQFNFLMSVFNSRSIKSYGTYKAYRNGTYAKSCNEYFKGVNGYQYGGETGDGVYRVKPDAGSAFDVYCDMTSNGGGWTRVSLSTLPSLPLNINSSSLGALAMTSDPLGNGLHISFSRVVGQEFRWGSAVSSKYGTANTMLYNMVNVIDSGNNNNKLGFSQGHTQVSVPSNDNGEACPFGITLQATPSLVSNGDTYYWNASCWGRTDAYYMPNTTANGRADIGNYSGVLVTDSIYIR